MKNNNWKKTFAFIWGGQLLSILSSTTVNFAVILWISLETGSAEMLAWVTIAALLPQGILGPICGAYVDRWNRKRVMMLADSFIAFCTLILALLFWLDIAQMWHIFILLGLRSVGSSFHMPAMQASIPLLAPEDQLSRIAGINQIISSISNIAGPALGALFITIWDMEYVLMLDVLGAMCAVISLLFVTIPNPISDGSVKDLLKEMKDGVNIILSNINLRRIFLFSIIATFFIMPVSVLFPLMTLDYFKGSEFQVSIIEIIWSVGALAGGAIMGARVYKVNMVYLVNAMYILLGLSFFLTGLLSPNGFILFALLTAIGGLSGAVYSSAFTSILQKNIDPAFLGRVFSLFFTVSLIPSLIGLVSIGFFADSLGLTLSFVVCGGILILNGIIAFITKVKSVKMTEGVD